MKKKQILVCGTGFGKIYLKAIAESKEYELMGILGKGSDRSRLLSKNLNVPMYTDIKEINQNVDAACVVVPNAAGGGNGANIAKSILAKGIPTLLEHPAHEVEIVNCIRESGSAAFMLNPFYRYIKPIRDFLEAAQIISKHAHLINASLECAIHVLYDGIDILGCALGGLSTWKLRHRAAHRRAKGPSRRGRGGCTRRRRRRAVRGAGECDGGPAAAAGRVPFRGGDHGEQIAAALPIRHSGACFRRRGHGLRPDRRQPHKRRAHREKRRSAAQQALFRGGGPAAREPQEPDGRGHYRLCRRGRFRRRPHAHRAPDRI